MSEHALGAMGGAVLMLSSAWRTRGLELSLAQGAGPTVAYQMFFYAQCGFHARLRLSYRQAGSIELPVVSAN